ncbi:hypothetical protein GW17_00015765 [Ensete ventricosum]|nr:hypothetical protein GW17_00015765 [Ensete ventricosum]RZS02559.1 hypothetical protein BHM03_00032623 [Ensete ventricosum]
MTWLAEEEGNIGGCSGRSDSDRGGSDWASGCMWQMRRFDAGVMTSMVGGGDDKGGASTQLCTAEASSSGIADL